jgi:hypothetical protein
MSQGPRTKHPLDVLQSMINGIVSLKLVSTCRILSHL